MQQPYREQWAKLEVLNRALEASHANITTLGLSVQASRVARWIELYGIKLGITQQTGNSDAEGVAVDAWHRAWQQFDEVVRYHVREGKVADATALREKLLAPYVDQAAAERAADKATRRS